MVHIRFLPLLDRISRFYIMQSWPFEMSRRGPRWPRMVQKGSKIGSQMGSQNGSSEGPKMVQNGSENGPKSGILDMSKSVQNGVFWTCLGSRTPPTQIPKSLSSFD